MTDVDVRDNPEKSRYEVVVDGEVAGFTNYEVQPDGIAFIHTEAGEQYGGQGLASRLVKFELDDSRARDRSVFPYCPFVRGYIAKHPEYRELVPEDQWAKFELVS